MSGDFSRSTFRTYKGYSSVRLQQGRLTLDADWNEAQDIRSHIERTAFRDAIGANGTPKKAAGYGITVTPGGADLSIEPGRLYLDGLLAEVPAEPVPVEEVHEDRVVPAALFADGRPLESGQWIELSAGSATVRRRIASVDPAARVVALDPAVGAAEVAALASGASLRRVITYTTQPDLPGPPLASGNTLKLDDGRYLVFADVWERHVTVLDDPELRETALGGPDTATRTKVVSQVRIARLDDATVEHCDQAPDPLALAGTRPPSTGRMQARAVPGDPGTEPCDLSAGGGYRGLENQLYRVEVHEAGPLSGATFKWSRDNASMVAKWLNAIGTKLTVSSQGPDDVLGFGSGQLVELRDDTRELTGAPGALVNLTAPPEGNVLTAETAVDINDFPGNPKVRRWDSPAEGAMTGGWIELEDGVQVRFDDGWYNTGDYWLIPARAAEGNVEWPQDAGGQPVPRGPDGIAHRYAKLALLRVDSGAITVMEDCRDRFPALTDLAAVDVTYDNAACAMPRVHTVQDALDQLCEDNNLSKHKRTLHGWGIVCGLQVVCGAEHDGRRREVIVRDGYAIDADGNDLDLEQDARLDVLRAIEDYNEAHPDEVAATPLLDDNGNGEVSLLLRADPDRGGDVRIDIERFDARRDHDADQMLAGTMLMDFYTECILPVQRFFEEELREPEGSEAGRGGLKSSHQQRAVLIGLIGHFLNQDSGQLIYISPQEDEILRAFYHRLKDLLSSETFCAMFENARGFRDYALADVRMSTIFGRGHHTRARLRPGKVPEVYTVGPGLNLKGPTLAINRYDLERGEYVASIDPIAGGMISGRFKRGADAVRDVAFSKDGKRIYAIAPTATGRDTFFRVGEIERDDIKWGELHTICGVKLVTLGSSGKDLYAIGLGSGLYRINPGAPDLSPSPLASFDATGQMAVADGRAYCLGRSSGAGRGVYDQLHGYAIPDGSPLFDPVELETPGRDDLAVATEAAGKEAVFVAVGSGARSVHAFDARSGARLDSKRQAVTIPIAEGPVSLAVNADTGVLLVAAEDAARVRLIDVRSMKMINAFVPVQVGPTSIVVDDRTRAAYVLNTVSSTLTVAGDELLTPKLRFPNEQLAAYRRSILDAFVDLTGGFLQYLKDCLCDHFLVRCPEPTNAQKIYLAAVSVRAEQVYKVCNFSKRRYVKSFPAVGYWLSLVPVAPMIDRLVDAFCCLIIPDRFARFASRDLQDATVDMGARYAPSKLRAGAFATQELDPMAKFADLKTKLNMAVMQLMSSFGPGRHNYAAPSPAPEPSEPVAAGVIGTKAEAAVTRFGDGVLVDRAERSEGGDVLGIIRGAFRTPRPGDRVRVLEEHGEIKSVSLQPAERVEVVTRQAGEVAPERVVTEPAGAPPVAEQRIAAQPSPDVLEELGSLRGRLEMREAEINVLNMRLAAIEGRQEILTKQVREREVAQPAVTAPDTDPVIAEPIAQPAVTEPDVTPRSSKTAESNEPSNAGDFKTAGDAKPKPARKRKRKE